MLRLICPGCDKTLAVPDARAGTEGTCPACRERFLIPAAPPPAPPPPPVRPVAARLRVVVAPAESSPLDREEDDEFEERVRRPKSPGRRRKRSRKADREPSAWYLGFQGALLGVGVLTASLLVLSLIHWAVAVLLILGGWAVALAGAMWFYVEAFRESPTEGLMCMFMPFYALYYTVTRFAALKRPLLLQLVGVGIQLLGLLVISLQGFGR